MPEIQEKTYKKGGLYYGRYSIEFPEKTLTKQEFKKTVDINNIIKRHDKTGLITHVNTMQAQYGDFSDTDDYQTSLDMVIAARDSFMSLPSEVRKKFGNDPANFLEFVTNPENMDEMIEMGLANPPEPPPAPVQVEITNPERPPAE